MERQINLLKALDWNFERKNTEYLTHGLHKYPGRMPPQIPRRIIQFFPRASHILDPFCGSGTTLVEAILAGKDATGIDINPLAVLISKVKTTPIPPRELKLAEKEVLREVKRRVYEVRVKRERYIPPFSPEEANLHYWFNENAIDELSAISTYLLRDFPIEKYGYAILHFFQLCLSNTVKKVSYQRSDEFKLYRMDDWKNHKVDVLHTFMDSVHCTKIRTRRLYHLIRKRGRINILRADFTKLQTKMEPADMVITSPPYGDSQTTVAYGQFSRYPLLWLGYAKEDVYTIDKISMGGDNKAISNLFPSYMLNKVLTKIEEGNSQRAKVVKSYFYDLLVTLKKIYDILNSDSPCCFVIGNRTVQNISIPSHLVLIEFGEQIGFKHLMTIERKISSKVLPKNNERVKTINRERIVILYKE
jgi:adenine-specific DNA methylase